MKQIKSMHHLMQEKKRLEQATEAATDKIKQNWTGFKEAIRPQSIASDAIGSVLKHATEPHHSDSILKSTLLYGINQLAKNIAEKAEAKLNKLFD
jgi:hypothetical protein